ncbi:hypothetical protein FQZ97_1151350 [compost metagenome]
MVEVIAGVGGFRSSPINSKSFVSMASAANKDGMSASSTAWRISSSEATIFATLSKVDMSSKRGASLVEVCWFIYGFLWPVTTQRGMRQFAASLNS